MENGKGDLKEWDYEERLEKHKEAFEKFKIKDLHPHLAEKRLDSTSCLETYAKQSKVWRMEGTEDFIITTSAQAERAARFKRYVQVTCTWVDKDPDFLKIAHPHVSTSRGPTGHIDHSNLKVAPNGFPLYGTSVDPKTLRLLCLQWMEKGFEADGITYSPGSEWNTRDPVYQKGDKWTKNRTGLVRRQYIALRVTDGGFPRTDVYEADGNTLYAAGGPTTCTNYSKRHGCGASSEKVCRHIAQHFPSSNPTGGG